MTKKANLVVGYKGKVIIAGKPNETVNWYKQIESVTINSNLVDLNVREAKAGKIEINFSGELELDKDFRIDAYIVDHELRISANFYNFYKNFNGDLHVDVAIPRCKMKSIQVNTTFNDLPNEVLVNKVDLFEIHTEKKSVYFDLFDSQNALNFKSNYVGSYGFFSNRNASKIELYIIPKENPIVIC